MASLTREQLQKINESCSNEWRLDIQYFMFHNEKQLTKNIELENNYFLSFKLYFDRNNQITLHISKNLRQEGYSTSEGLGKFKRLDSTMFARKNLKELYKYTEILNDEKLLEINANTEVYKSPMFVPSENF